MGILDAVLGGNNTQLVSQLARSVGIDESAVQSVVTQLLPAFSKGIKNNIGSSGGLSSLINALDSGNHQQYLKSPEKLAESAAVDDGNSILGHIFGNKDVSRNVAGHAAQATGVDSSIVKKLLPLLATTVMGALSKNTVASSLAGAGVSSLLGGNSSMVSNLVTSFLDSDNDGDITDDLLNLAKKFF